MWPIPRVGHNIPRNMRPKIVVSQKDRGDDLPTPTKGWWWEVIPSLLLRDHHFFPHFSRKLVTYPEAEVGIKGSYHSYPFGLSMDCTVVEKISKFLHVFYSLPNKSYLIWRFYNLRTYDFITPWCVITGVIYTMLRRITIM